MGWGETGGGGGTKGWGGVRQEGLIFYFISIFIAHGSI